MMVMNHDISSIRHQDSPGGWSIDDFSPDLYDITHIKTSSPKNVITEKPDYPNISDVDTPLQTHLLSYLNLNMKIMPPSSKAFYIV